ncbi:hypothetical protein [Streptococcus intermedius]|nr:hypothetical protein [Streptococcus intermedius]RSJ20040.1 hypothetical protein D8829_06110 [Streptococcus intermedius]
MYLKYKHMQIVKHALQYYIQRAEERATGSAVIGNRNLPQSCDWILII